MLERLSEGGKTPVRPAWIIFATHKRAIIIAKDVRVLPTYLSYCKDLMKIVPELHQLDGIKGNFMISEREYLALLILFEEGKIAPQIIYSNINDIVEQQQYVFDTFWSNGRPAEQRIKEIEEGIVTRYETRVLENPQQINNHLKYVIENAAERLLFYWWNAVNI